MWATNTTRLGASATARPRLRQLAQAGWQPFLGRDGGLGREGEGQVEQLAQGGQRVGHAWRRRLVDRKPDLQVAQRRQPWQRGQRLLQPPVLAPLRQAQGAQRAQAPGGLRGAGEEGAQLQRATQPQAAGGFRGGEAKGRAPVAQLVACRGGTHPTNHKDPPAAPVQPRGAGQRVAQRR